MSQVFAERAGVALPHIGRLVAAWSPPGFRDAREADQGCGAVLHPDARARRAQHSPGRPATRSPLAPAWLGILPGQALFGRRWKPEVFPIRRLGISPHIQSSPEHVDGGDCAGVPFFRKGGIVPTTGQ